MDNQPQYQPAPTLPPPQPNTGYNNVGIPARKSRSYTWVLWLIIILLIAGIAGVYLWQHKKVTDLQSKTSSSSSKTVVTTTKTNQQYLYLYDYGIKVPLTNSIKDLYYVSLRSSAVNGDQLSFSSETLTNDNVACAAEPGSSNDYLYQSGSDVSANPAQTTIEGNPLGTVIITSKALPSSQVGTADDQYGELVAHVNGSYLYYSSPQAACSSGNSVYTNSTQTDQKAELESALKNTQAI